MTQYERVTLTPDDVGEIELAPSELTQAEKVVVVRRVRRRCRGPLVVDNADVQTAQWTLLRAVALGEDLSTMPALLAERHGIAMQDAQAMVTSVERLSAAECVQAAIEMVKAAYKRALELAAEYSPTPQKVVAAPRAFTPGDWVEMERSALPLLRLRGERIGKGCGYDITVLISEGPFDGQEHAYTCPQCGNSGTYTAPHFVGTKRADFGLPAPKSDSK